MTRSEIPIDTLSLPVFHTFDARWMLLAAGDFGRNDYNFMTISWGSLGMIWDKPFAHVMVRGSRHTRQFIEKADSFTLSVFPEEHHRQLSYCGSHSGRDGDKAKASGFTPIASRRVSAPAFDEAELVIECRKTYYTDLEPGHFLDPKIQTFYPTGDYHRIFYGEVVAVSGTAEYSGTKAARRQPTV